MSYCIIFREFSYTNVTCQLKCSPLVHKLLCCSFFTAVIYTSIYSHIIHFLLFHKLHI